jgi:hypothetical protein
VLHCFLATYWQFLHRIVVLQYIYSLVNPGFAGDWCSTVLPRAQVVVLEFLDFQRRWIILMSCPLHTWEHFVGRFLLPSYWFKQLSFLLEITFITSKNKKNISVNKLGADSTYFNSAYGRQFFQVFFTILYIFCTSAAPQRPEQSAVPFQLPIHLGNM